MKRKLVLGFTALVLMINTGFAQSEIQKWAVGINLGVEQYKGELGSSFYRFGQDLNGFVGLDFSRYLTPHFDAAVSMTYGDMGYYNNIDPIIFTRQNMFQASILGRYNILTDAYKWRPYVFLGFGHLRFADGSYSQGNTVIPYGLGLTYQVKPNIAIRLQETFMYSDFDRMDADPSKKLNDSYLQHSIGLVFNIGKTKNDADKDGVADEDDDCPSIPGTKASNGCPDQDGDGVPDDQDECPTLKGTAANKGCPELDEKDKQTLKDALYGINFETGSDVLSESSYNVLDRVAMILSLNVNYKLIIEGHTDSQGNDDLNMALSEKRANAVRNYLISKGVAADRLTAIGYGETKPIADNETAEGRAENRRVELKVKF